jgi:hypothetical protein
LLSREVCCDARRLHAARAVLGRCATELRAIDPLQHHGHFVVSEIDLGMYHQSHFPLAVWRHAQRLDQPGPMPLDIYPVDDGWSAWKAFLEHVQVLRHVHSTGRRPRTAYDAKLLIQTAVMVPLLALQVIQRRYRYKREALPAALELLSEAVPAAHEAWDVIRRATHLRETWRYEPLLSPAMSRRASTVGPSYRFPELVERVYSARAVRAVEAIMGDDYIEKATRMADLWVQLGRSAAQNPPGDS